MTALIIIGAIIIGVIGYIVDEGSFSSKLVLAALVAAVAFILVYWVTAWVFFKTLATVCAVAAIVIIAFSLIKNIFSGG